MMSHNIELIFTQKVIGDIIVGAQYFPAHTKYQMSTL